MPTPQLGSFYFLTMDGEIITPRYVIEEITRECVVGSAFRIIGQRGRPFRVQTVIDVADTLSVYNLAYGYSNLIGSLQTLVDCLGNTFPNCMVLEANVRQARAYFGAIGGDTGGGSGYLVPCDWVLQLT